MPILVSDIRSRLEEPRDSIVEKALLKLGTSRSAVRKAAVSKTSVDARKGKISLFSSVLLEFCGDEEALVKRLCNPHVVFRR